MPTATIRDVELVSVGTWAASTGVTKVTRSDLEAMLAAHEDGLVDHAPVKLGHVSPLNDQLGDGAPAYGWVVPTRIGTNANGLETLFGDLVGMPSKLAEVAPAAYRRRSVEIAWNVKTPAGKTYPAALVGVALLGASAPAVKGLADVLALYTEEPAAIESTSALELVAGLEDNPHAAAMLAAARQAGATVAQLDAMASAAGAHDTADVPPPVDDTADDSHEHTDPAGDAGAPDGRTTMTDEELRAALNLEADANIDEAIRAILDERTGGDQGNQGGDQGTDTGDQGGQGTSSSTDTAPAATSPATPSQEPELVQLSAATYAELTAAAETIQRDRRTRVLDDAVRAGRIAPAERGKLTHELADGEQVTGFAAAIERDEEGTTTLLSSLAPRFATTELGDSSTLSASVSDEAWDSFERDTFPELNR